MSAPAGMDHQTNEFHALMWIVQPGHYREPGEMFVVQEGGVLLVGVAHCSAMPVERGVCEPSTRVLVGFGSRDFVEVFIEWSGAGAACRPAWQRRQIMGVLGTRVP